MKLTEAVLEVLGKHGGAATVASLFAEVPQLTNAIKSEKTAKIEHSIRGSLSYLMGDSRGSRKCIKRIGLATYALMDYEVKNNLFNEIATEKVEQKSFLALPRTKLHGHLQGMLIEIGNMKKFQTYTPDKNVIFNGKSLAEVSSVKTIPQFTYQTRLKKIAKIDVIWFKNGYPVKTFDVENSTDFTNALVRCSQLENFKTKFVMVANKKKRGIFADRIATHPFNKLRDSVTLWENEFVFEYYKRAMHLHELKPS